MSSTEAKAEAKRKARGGASSPGDATPDDDETEYSEWAGSPHAQGDGVPRERKLKSREERNAESELPQVDATQSWEKRKQSIKTRVFWSWCMVFGFAGIIAMGHFWVAMFVVSLTILMFREIINLKRNKEKDKHVGGRVVLFRVWGACGLAVGIYSFGGSWSPFGSSCCSGRSRNVSSIGEGEQ